MRRERSESGDFGVEVVGESGLEGGHEGLEVSAVEGGRGGQGAEVGGVGC